ncbi:30S ribosome-binding factor RbfA [Rhodospira trueperi]|uniref:Ribosome-binding factor A n=1 Tax=Rhodospira trueperi TaxID=69960 RepID=A0A1G7D6X3_9PROT|nr:30S ribosome-binding factor RbfA [Rhodospira trueperi]SDE47263.1 ribosome-binding factor A [Rhodospira trueperi]
MRRDPARAAAKQAGKPQSQRQLRVGEELRHALAWTLEKGNIRDPVLAATPVTITEVRASPDLRNATVFCMPLGGGEAAEAEVLEALRRVKPFLRHEVASRVRLRHVPDLSFATDTSFDTANRIEALLHSPEVARDVTGDDDGRDEDENIDKDIDKDGGHGA